MSSSTPSRHRSSEGRMIHRKQHSNNFNLSGMNSPLQHIQRPASPGTGRRRLLNRRHSSGLATSDTSDNHSNTAVYVKDAAYVWLPAQIQSSVEDHIVVKVVLPDEWVETTILQDKSSIAELEQPMTSGGFENYTSPKSEYSRGHSNLRKLKIDNALKGRKWYNYERAQLEFDESIPKGVMRTIKLSDYANSEPPLQNTDRHAQRLLSRHKHYQKNTIYHPIINARDMADLHYLHEAAILYNLKLRHGKSLPYTRVGDIVVAVNPFEWIESLYSTEKQALYARHLIWEAKDCDEIVESEKDTTCDQISGVQSRGEEVMNEDGLLSISSLATEERSTDESKKDKHEPMSHGSIYSKLGLEPHVFELAALAYRGLACNRQNQTILVSGESGAGKTETVKIVMSNLATVEKTRPFYHPKGKVIPQRNRGTDGIELNGIVRQVLDSNPVFEAFGCAKTIRNDNSSRFGRFTQLQYEVESKRDAEYNSRQNVPNCLLVGSHCITYLLEKNRVVRHANGERNYHIFYQLICAPEREKSRIWKGLKGTTYDSFNYIGDIDANKNEAVSEKENWSETVNAMKVFGFQDDSFRQLLRALCVVLQLGNLTFSPVSTSEEGSDISSLDEMEKLSSLVGISKEKLTTALTLRINKIRGEEVISKPNAKDAKDGCDALAKTIYSCIFGHLVKQINDHTSVESQEDYLPCGSIGTISLLDIFGFERFETNRFEQLCINFSNERLQHRYVLDNFRAVKEEYTAEGIDIFDFSMVDNSGVLKLLEGKLGLITSLNEECMRPQGNPGSFVYKLKMLHSDSKHLLVDRLQEHCEFGISHFAGAVTYDATEFLKSNADLTPKDLINCVCESSNPFISSEFNALISDEKEANNGPRRRNRAKRTVIAKFRSQLNILMESIELTKTRYIRTIKPNNDMIPRRINHRDTMNQLESAGLVTAITISRETFPNRLPYNVIWDRFNCLRHEHPKEKQCQMRKFSEIQLRGLVAQLLTSLLLKSFTRADGVRVPSFSCGRTKVYFRTGALEDLENERMEYYSIHASTLQTWYRSHTCRLNFVRAIWLVIKLQSNVRTMIEKKKLRALRKAIIVIQSLQRMKVAKKSHASVRGALVKLQGNWRGLRQRSIYKSHIQLAITFQTWARAYLCRESYLRVMRSITKIQAFWRGTKARMTVLRMIQKIANRVEIEEAAREDHGSCDRSPECLEVDQSLQFLDANSQAVRFARVRPMTEDQQETSSGGSYSHIATSSLSSVYASCESSLPSDGSSGTGRVSRRESHRRNILDALNQGEVHDLREEIISLKKETRDLFIEVEIRDRDLDAIKESCASAENENSSLRSQIHSDRRKIARFKDQNFAAEQQLQSLRFEQESLEMKMASMVEEDQSLQQTVARLEKNEEYLKRELHTIQSSSILLRQELELRSCSLETAESQLKTLEVVDTNRLSELGTKTLVINELKQKVELLEDENAEMNVEVDSSYTEVNALRNQIKTLIAENEKMNIELKKSFDEVNSKSASLDSISRRLKIAEIKKTQMEKDSSIMMSDFQRLEVERNSQRTQIFSLLQQNETCEATVQDLSGKIIDASGQLNDLTVVIEGKVKENKMCQGKNVLLTKEREALGDQVTTLISEADECKRLISSFDDSIKSKNIEASELKGQLASIQQHLSARDIEVNNCHSQIKDLNEMINVKNHNGRDFIAKISFLESDLAACKDELREYLNLVPSLNEMVEERDGKVNNLSIKITSLEDDLTTRERELLALNEKITSQIVEVEESHVTASSLNEELEALKKAAEAKSAKVSDIKQEASSLRQALTSSEQHIISLKGIIESGEVEIKEMKNEIASHVKGIAEGEKRFIALNNQLALQDETIIILRQQIHASGNQSAAVNIDLDAKNTELKQFRSNAVTTTKAMQVAKAEIDGVKQKLLVKDNTIRVAEELVSLRGVQIDDHQTEIDSLVHTVDERGKEIISLNEQLSSQKNINASLQIDIISLTQTIDDNEEEFTSLNNQVNFQKDTITSSKKNIAEYQIATQNSEGEKDNLHAQVSTLIKTLEDKESAFVDLRRNISSIKEELASRDSELSVSQNKNSSSQQCIFVLERDIQERDDIVSQLQDKLTSLQQENGKIDKALQSKSIEFDKRKDEVLALQQEVSASVEETTELENEKILLQSSINDLQARLAEQKESFSGESDKFVTKLEAHEIAMLTLQEKVEGLTNDNDAQVGEINSLQKILDDKHREGIDLKKTLHLLKSELVQMKTKDLHSKCHSQSLQVRIDQLERMADKESEERETLNSRVMDLSQEKEDLANKYNVLTAEISNRRTDRDQFDSEKLASLNAQVTILEEENIWMKNNLDELDRGRLDLMNQMQSLVVSGKSANNRSQALLITNKSLHEKISALQLENTHIKREMHVNTTHSQHENEKCIQTRFKRLLQDRESEIYELKESLANNIKERAYSSHMSETKMHRERETFLSEIHDLKDSLHKVKGHSDDYKSKIIDALQTSHSTRERETRKLKKEIKRLQLEVKEKAFVSSTHLKTKCRHAEVIKQNLLANQKELQQKLVMLMKLFQSLCDSTSSTKVW
eukprot:CAMPEP_0194108514 /NCGR_PEP_ID=MMETSP0150-20130528/8181_1 /TAXON_ID=122233 /ORGANISM="Chaetoceros debilis, Strain MM31A-1" /LENGTH=2569 /DNA_ID=CAMNT_0038797229 /DNA_START=146 /DNA_END=7852 /DNA_ORIENTATION=-